MSGYVCPALSIRYSWSVAEAEFLDDRGGFVESVRSKIEQVMTTWGQLFEPRANKELADKV